jgi:hypothetical protein
MDRHPHRDRWCGACLAQQLAIALVFYVEVSGSNLVSPRSPLECRAQSVPDVPDNTGESRSLAVSARAFAQVDRVPVQPRCRDPSGSVGVRGSSPLGSTPLSSENAAIPLMETEAFLFWGHRGTGGPPGHARYSVCLD